MKKSTNFTANKFKLSIVLALAVAGQLLVSVPAQAVASPESPKSNWELIIEGMEANLLGLKNNLVAAKEACETAIIGVLEKNVADAEKELATLKAAGCKSCNKTETPEPLTIFGVGATLASLPAFKKYYNKKNKQEETV